MKGKYTVQFVYINIYFYIEKADQYKEFYPQENTSNPPSPHITRPEFCSDESDYIFSQEKQLEWDGTRALLAFYIYFHYILTHIGTFFLKQQV